MFQSTGRDLSNRLQVELSAFEGRDLIDIDEAAGLRHSEIGVLLRLKGEVRRRLFLPLGGGASAFRGEPAPPQVI